MNFQEAMNTEDFLDYLISLNIKLTVNNENKLKLSAPPGILTPDLKTRLSERKDEIISILRSINNPKNFQIQPISRDGNLPLSFTQQRLWLLDQLEPESSAYIISRAFRLLGCLRVSVLEQSLNEIIKRHEILRTSFKVVDGQPNQVISPPFSINLTIIDLQHIPEAKREIEAKKLLSVDILRPFNLQQAPLFRLGVIKIAENNHILAINVHHIIFDGWSVGLFLDELSSLYNGFLQNDPAPLKTLPIQYADFSAWQQQRLDSENFQLQLRYWKHHLKNVPQVLELPNDYPRPSVQNHQGAFINQQLSLSLSQQIKELGQQESATLFMTLLAAFKILCYRFTNQEHITIGSPIAGRNQTEVEHLIGFFVTNLVLFSDLSGNPSCREFLRRVRQVSLEAFANQDVPFEKLLEELQIKRDRSRNSLFQVWFNLLNLDEPKLILSGLSVELIQSETISSKFDLTLYAKDTDQGISFKWVYNSNLFAQNTIQQMSHCFQVLLENMVIDPNQKITTLPLLNASNSVHCFMPMQHKVVPASFVKFEKTEIEQSVPSRFEKKVNQYANCLAIKTQRYEWTYQDLSNKANQIAQLIIQVTDDGTESVALLFEHDAPMVAAILGVLKAGRIYIPLDPLYPVERLRYILADSGAKIILTNGQNLNFAKELSSELITVIDIEQLPKAVSAIAPNIYIKPDTIAYILYTSGSTGRPKGVVQNHRNVLHFIRNQTNRLFITSEDRLSLFASYSFDAAVVDIFSTLLNGATLYLFDVKKQGLTSLSCWLDHHKITIYHSTPTLYRQFLDILSLTPDQSRQELSTIRAVVMGGEKSLPHDIDLYQDYFSLDCLFINLYGSTESTISLEWFINKGIDTNLCFISLGCPIDDVEILLLNESGEETQIYGEIAIRSAHLALGYWQQPELTQSVFFPDPKGGDRRIYRTGDLGRLRADGTIEFLGRQDFQVKLRGFRIELREIEITLCNHPQLKEAIVVGQEDETGSKQLVAYLITSSEEKPSIQDLHHFIKAKLPDYMVPSAFIFLDEFPLTPSGKIHRKALPKPDFSQRLIETEFVAPQTSQEQQLADIWTRVLKLDQVGIYDNFFEIGGNSLLAVQIFSEIERRFDIKLPLSIIFNSPSIHNLALAIQNQDKLSLSSPIVALQPLGSKIPIFGVHAIGTSVQFYRGLAQYLGLDQPFYGIQSCFLDYANPELTVEDMAAIYIEEIKTIQSEGPYILTGYSFGGRVVYEMAQQLHKSGQEVSLLAIIDTPAPGGRKRLTKQKQLLKHWHNFRNFGIDYAAKKASNQLNFRTEQIKSFMLSRLKANENDLDKTIFFEARLQQIKLLHTQVLKKYKVTEYPKKLTLFISDTKPDNIGDEWEPTLGWNKFATGGLEIHIIPGTHHSIFEEPHVKIFAEKFKDCLNRIS